MGLDNMALDEAAHVIPVLRDEALVYPAMIFKVETDSVRVQKVDPALDDQLLSDVLENLSQGHILACLIQQLVKTEALDRIGGQLALRKRPLTDVQVGPKLSEIILRSLFQGHQRGWNLQQILHRMNLHNFLHTEFLYKDSLMGDLFQQPILLKTDDGFPDGRTAAIQLFADNIIANLLARLHIELQDGPFEPVVYLSERTLPKIIHAMC